MSSRYARFKRSLKRLEVRLAEWINLPDPDAWWNAYSDEDFLEAFIPYCRVEAGFEERWWGHRRKFWSAYTTLARRVIAAGEAGNVPEARRLFGQMERFHRYYTHLGPNFWTVKPKLHPTG